MAKVEQLTPAFIKANKPKDYSASLNKYNKVTGYSVGIAGKGEWMKKQTEWTPEKETQKLIALNNNDLGENLWTAGDQAGVDSIFQQDLQNASQGLGAGSSGGDSSNGSGFMNSLASMGVGKMAGGMLAGIGESIGGDKYGTFSEDEKASQDSIRGALEMIPGYGTAIAAATGAVDAVGSATGLNLSSVDKDTASRAGVKGTEFNKIMNMLPGNSIIWGSLSRAFGNGRTDSLDVSDEVLGMADGFSGTVKDLQAAKDLGNKQLFFGQTDAANKFINSQKQALATMNYIQSVNTQRKQSDYYQDLQNQNINRYAGQNFLGTHVGKQGMKLMSVEEARKIIALRKTIENPEKLQNGGNIPGIDSSILPEGALHKNKHHLDEVNPELEDATKKGIPVMAADGGEVIDQVAEIENNELIFSKTITDKLEELMKDGSEEAMIEAGKLISQEIIENTVDNTGQITEEVENGKD